MTYGEAVSGDVSISLEWGKNNWKFLAFVEAKAHVVAFAEGAERSLGGQNTGVSCAPTSKERSLGTPLSTSQNKERSTALEMTSSRGAPTIE